MPTYAYKCERCTKEFDVVKPMKDYASSEKCPDCHVIAKRIISGGAGFILNGPGFYQNDYKGK